MKSKIVLPYAPILVESTRSIGYSFEAALADMSLAIEIICILFGQDRSSIAKEIAKRNS